MLAASNAGAALFRAAGNSKVTMRIALLVNAVNVGGNVLLILVLKLGVVGAALSTLVSRSIAAAIIFALLIADPRLPVSLAGLTQVKLVPRMIRNILNVGIPSGFESSMFQLGRLLTQRIFTSYGTAAIAGNAIAGVINSFSFMPGMAYAMTLLTVVGQCTGAGDYEGARKNTAKIMRFSYLTIFLVNLAIVLFIDPLIGLFNLSGEAYSYARLFLIVHCISMTLGWTPSFALPNALRAAGDARYVMIAGSVSMWLVRVSAAYLFCFVLKLGPLGVWLAMGADFVVRGSCFVLRWRGGKWETKRVIRD
jgi:putative MATE family efflux protein